MLWSVAFLYLLAACPVVRAEEPALRLGWRGSYLIGSWAEAAIQMEVAEAGAYEVRVTAPDPDGNRVTFSSPTDLSPGKQTLRGYFKVGNLDPALEVTVVATSSGKSIWTAKSLGSLGAASAAPIDPSVRLVATVGKPPGFEWSDTKPGPSRSSEKAGSSRAVDVSADELPIDARAYDSVSMLVIAGQTVLSLPQADAVRDWIASGGRLLISLPQDPKLAQAVVQPFASWLPVTVGDQPVTVSEFGRLESFARKNVRILLGRLPIPSVKVIQGEVLAGSRDDALLVRSPYGLGSATVLSLDVTQPPLSKWSELSSLTQRLADTSDLLTTGSTGHRNTQLSTTGITDFATQLHAGQEDFAGVNRASPWFVMGLMVLLLLAIGPIDYVLVHRLLKWPRGTWITFPLWIGLAALLTGSLAKTWNGTAIHVNQLNIVNIDANSSTCHQRLWTNIYSPSTERQSVGVTSRIVSGSKSQQTSWSGVAETAFTGMLRPANVQVGAADYRVSDGKSIDDLPLVQWSSKPLLAEFHASSAGLVDSDLQTNGVGQLSGTITHRLPGPIEDWVLAFGNRIYRHKKTREDPQSLPLASRQVLRIDQPNVYPRELRAFLTGKSASGRPQGSQATDVASQFVSYDPLSRDPADILRILTFHNEVGGIKYTGLTNRLLEKEDLSHLLRLGRAVLFGRLNSPIASLQLNGKEVAPDRETTFVRIVLPVKKISMDLRPALERLDK
ncbi:MAG: hypothetical protein JWP89_1511 [Schlesneria sp.]|nr:hypothetical protein [Schlesneria sp.]